MPSNPFLISKGNPQVRVSALTLKKVGFDTGNREEELALPPPPKEERRESEEIKDPAKPCPS